MSQPYRVLVVGLGKRGTHHAAQFHANPNFQLVGLCDVDAERLAKAAAAFGNPATGADAAALAQQLQPDVFCFCTLPALRLPLLRAGIACGAKLIAFEKPVALTSAEGREMHRLLQASGVKAVVSHQHRYGTHYRRVREIAASGALGRLHTVYGTATGWSTHMLSHLVDYARWYAGEPAAEWAMAQAAGRLKLADNHPSPDYLAGVVQFAGGIRGTFEVGAGAPDQPEVAKWWGKNRVGVQGTEGFAEVLTNGGWRALTKRGGYESGDGAMNYELDMPGYIQDLADWLHGTKVHPCHWASAYAGFEITMALWRSVVDRGQVALPLTDDRDELAELRRVLPDRRVIPLAVNAKEYGG